MHTLARHLSGWGRRKSRGRFTTAAPFAAAWLFEGGGTASKQKDWSGLGNTLSPQGTVAYTGGPFGGPSYSSDGVTSYFTAGDNTLLRPASFTLVAWVWPKTVGGVNTNYIASKTNSSSAGWSLSEDAAGSNLNFTLNGGGTTLSAAMPSTNAWHQVAATYDGGSKKAALYVDGVQKTTASSITLTSSTQGLQVTNSTTDPGSPGPFPGYIDHFLFLSVALSSQAIAELFREPFRLFKAYPLRLPIPTLAATFPVARKPRARRRSRPSRRRKRAGRQLPLSPTGHCPAFQISEALSGTLRVRECLQASGLAAEPLSVSAGAVERLSAAALVAESLSATAKVVPCP